MISSPSAQIVNAVAESHLMTAHGERVSAYGPTMGVATAIIVLGIMATVCVGPEKRGSHFESAVIGQKTMAMNAAAEKGEDLERGSIGGEEKAREVEGVEGEKK